MLAFVLATMIFAAADQTPATTGTEAAPAPAAAASAKKPEGDRLICRREAKANSRFTTKTCKTAQEWEDRAEEARKALAETQQRPMVSIDKGS